MDWVASPPKNINCTWKNKFSEICGSPKNIEIRGSQKPCEASQLLSFLNRHVLGQT